MGHPTVQTPRLRCHKVKGKRRRPLISAIAEIFRIEVRGVWRGHIRGDEHDTLPRKLETFPALAARDQFIDTNHVRPRERESLLVLFARAAWQLALLRSDNPSNRVIVFLAARRTCEGNALGVLLFGIELAFVHDVAAPSVPAINGSGARRPSRIAYCGQIDCNKFEAGVAPAWQPMFERSDNVMPVAAESAMIAVM